MPQTKVRNDVAEVPILESEDLQTPYIAPLIHD